MTRQISTSQTQERIALLLSIALSCAAVVMSGCGSGGGPATPLNASSPLKSIVLGGVSPVGQVTSLPTNGSSAAPAFLLGGQSIGSQTLHAGDTSNLTLQISITASHVQFAVSGQPGSLDVNLAAASLQSGVSGSYALILAVSPTTTISQFQVTAISLDASGTPSAPSILVVNVLSAASSGSTPAPPFS